MKNSSKDRIRRMQVQDALGISRKKKGYIDFNWKTYYTVKIALIACIPVLYFLYSPLLLVAVLAYAVAVGFMNRNKELALNDNFRKDCQVKLPGYDVVIAVIVVLAGVIGMIAVTFLQKSNGSMLGEFDDDALEKFKNGNLNPGNSAWREIKQFFVNLGSVMTGERSLFRSLRIGMKAPPDGGSAPPSSFEFRKSISISDMPLSFIFSTIFATLNTILIWGVSLLGGLSFIGIKKVRRKTQSERGKNKRYRYEKEETSVSEKDMEALRQENDILLGIFDEEFNDKTQ